MVGQEPRHKIETAEAKEKFRQAMDNHPAVVWVRAHPWSAVSLALGAGVVMGRSRRVRGTMAGGAGRLVKGLMNLSMLALAKMVRRREEEEEKQRKQEQPAQAAGR